MPLNEWARGVPTFLRSFSLMAEARGLPTFVVGAPKVGGPRDHREGQPVSYREAMIAGTSIVSSPMVVRGHAKTRCIMDPTHYVVRSLCW
jgi:hypothetical protein